MHGLGCFVGGVVLVRTVCNRLLSMTGRWSRCLWMMSSPSRVGPCRRVRLWTLRQTRGEGQLQPVGVPGGDEDDERGDGEEGDDAVQQRGESHGLRPEGEAERHDGQSDIAGDAGGEVHPPHRALHLQRRLEPFLRFHSVAGFQGGHSHAGDHVVETSHDHLEDDGDGHSHEAEPGHGARVSSQGEETVEHEECAADDDDGDGVGQHLVAGHGLGEFVEFGAGHGVDDASAGGEGVADGDCGGAKEQGPAAELLFG